MWASPGDSGLDHCHGLACNLFRGLACNLFRGLDHCHDLACNLFRGLDHCHGLCQLTFLDTHVSTASLLWM